MIGGMRDEPSPKSLLEKLGVMPGHRVSVLGIGDRAFLADLRASGADVSTRRRSRTDLVFLAVDDAVALGTIGGLEPYLERDGAVWVVYPRGRREIPEVAVIRAGVAQGLVDNKVVRFSDSHTALRFVIPRERR
jgi:hypothetical protein